MKQEYIYLDLTEEQAQLVAPLLEQARKEFLANRMGTTIGTLNDDGTRAAFTFLPEAIATPTIAAWQQALAQVEA
jgi:hypothetical protein